MRLTWVRRRGWLIATSAVACALIAVAIASVLPDKYTAEAIVAVPQDRETPSSGSTARRSSRGHMPS